MNAWVVPGYTEERELGRGASGRVVAATRDDTGQHAAIKYLAPRLFGDPGFVARFREEAELLRSLDVPQVVRLFDYVESPGEGAAIVMELVNGVSLHQMITRQGAASPESALAVLKGSLLGLASAHQLGIVHRDYKPENVLVDDAGNSKLTDFGVAVKAGKKAPVAGTPLYMAPEQWDGEPASPAADVYAATAVFFECLTGKTPFSGRLGQLGTQHKTAAVPVAMVDQPLQALIEHGMAKNPGERPADALEFVAELNWTAENAYGPDWEERGRSQLAERAAALLLLLLGGVAGAAGGSFAATLLNAMARRKKAVIAGAAAGIVAAAAVTTTTLTLQGNKHPTASPPTTTTATTSPPTTSPATTTPATTTPATTSPATTSPATTSPPTTPPPTTSPPTTSPATTSPATTSPATTSPPTTNPPPPPPTTPAPTTAPPPPPPPPVLTLTVTSVTYTGNSGACPATLPALTVPGTIKSDRATTVTYHWARSNGTSSGSAQVKIPAGGTVSVPDSVTPASNLWQISDTLTVTSPSSISVATKVTVRCSYPTLTLKTPLTQYVSPGKSLNLDLQSGYLSGGNGPYIWKPTGLPPWLSISQQGVISGTRPQGDTRTYTVTVTVTDSEASPQSASTQAFYIEAYYIG